MNSIFKGLIIFSLFFATLTYVICSFFVDTYTSLGLSLFAGAFYALVFKIISDFRERKIEKVLSGINEELLYNTIVNHYTDELIISGVLALTNTALIFISIERHALKVQIPIHEIIKLEYCRIYRHIFGLCVTTESGGKERFSLIPNEFEYIKHKIENI